MLSMVFTSLASSRHVCSPLKQAWGHWSLRSKTPHSFFCVCPAELLFDFFCPYKAGDTMATVGLNSCVKSLRTHLSLSHTHTHTHTLTHRHAVRALYWTLARAISCPLQASATFALPKAGRDMETLPGFRRRYRYASLSFGASKVSKNI